MHNTLEQIHIDPGVLDLLDSFVQQQGLHCEALQVARTQTQTKGRLPITTWWALLNNLYQLCPQDDLGHAIGQCLQPHHAGVLGYLAMSSATLGQALMRFHRYQPLLHNLVPTHFRAEQGVVVLGWSTARKSTPLSDQVVGSALLRFAHWVTGRNDIKPRWVRSPQPTPANTQWLEHAYGCPVEFNSPVNEFHFDAHWMTLPIRTKDPYLSGLLEKQAEAMLQALPQHDDLLSQVQHHLSQLLQDGTPTLVAVAQRLNTSERSLYRALEAKGVSFKGLLQSLRLELAKGYLQDEGLSLPEVALLLGFADQSVFSRAFKQWTGQSPLQWRKQFRL